MPHHELHCPTGPSRPPKNTLDKFIVVGRGATADCHNIAGLRPTLFASVAPHHTGTHGSRAQLINAVSYHCVHVDGRLRKAVYIEEA